MTARMVAAAILGIASCACQPTQSEPPAAATPVAPSQASAPSEAAPQAPDGPQSGAQRVRPPIRRHPPASSPGWRVPGTTVSLPRTAAAGTTVSGSAPAGSRVEFLGQAIDVGEDGRFQIAVPGDASGSLPVRIERPGTTALVLRLDIER